MNVRIANSMKALVSLLVAAILAASFAVVPRAHAVLAIEKRAESDALFEQIDAMQSGLNEMKALRDKATAEYEEAIELRDEAQQQIEECSARLADLQDKLSAFAVEMYKEDGAANFLGVMLQTSTFQDFLISVDRCTLITNAGKDLLDEERAVRADLEAARATYEEQSERAERQMKAAESAVKQIEETQAELREEAERLAEEADELEEEEEEEASELSDEEAEEAEKEREEKEAEIEERAQEAAAAAAAAAASAHAEVSAAVLLGDGYFTDPCPTSTNSSGFGYRDFDNAFHKGVDMAASQGTPFYAADSGTVIYATNDGGYNGGAGNWVVISHGDGVVTKYMHAMSTFVKPGDQVERGENIGLVGTTGQSTGPHLHFQVEVDGVAVNPLNYL